MIVCVCEGVCVRERKREKGKERTEKRKLVCLRFDITRTHEHLCVCEKKNKRE